MTIIRQLSLFSIQELYDADGEKVDSVDLSKDNDWKHTFKDLPEMDESDETIEYTVEEVEIKGYNVSITGDAEKGFTVTNTEVNEEPTEPTDPTDKGSNKPIASDDTQEESGNKLPKTATNMFNMFLIGAGMLVAGFVLLVYRKRKVS